MSYEVPKKIAKASKELMRAVIKASGGTSAIANSIGCQRQIVHTYIKAGYVPLVQAYTISSILGLSPWVISYFKLVEVFGERSPEFSKIVDSSKLPPIEKTRILAMID